MNIFCILVRQTGVALKNFFLPLMATIRTEISYTVTELKIIYVLNKLTPCEKVMIIKYIVITAKKHTFFHYDHFNRSR